MKKQYLEYQVEVNILKGKLEEKDKLLLFQDSTKILDDILSSQRSPAINLVLVFMKLLKVNLAHKLKQGTLVKNLKFSTRR